MGEPAPRFQPVPRIGERGSAMDSPSGGFWSIITIVGPIVLAAVLLWALLRNRKTTPREDDRTDRATRDVYRAEEAEHHGESDNVP